MKNHFIFRNDSALKSISRLKAFESLGSSFLPKKLEPRVEAKVFFKEKTLASTLGSSRLKKLSRLAEPALVFSLAIDFKANH